MAENRDFLDERTVEARVSEYRTEGANRVFIGLVPCEEGGAGRVWDSIEAYSATVDLGEHGEVLGVTVHWEEG